MTAHFGSLLGFGSEVPGSLQGLHNGYEDTPARWFTALRRGRLVTSRVQSGSGVPVLVLAARGSWHEMVKRWRANVRPKTLSRVGQTCRPNPSSAASSQSTQSNRGYPP
jgi:hypothetical protein